MNGKKEALKDQALESVNGGDKAGRICHFEANDRYMNKEYIWVVLYTVDVDYDRGLVEVYRIPLKADPYCRRINVSASFLLENCEKVN